MSAVSLYSTWWVKPGHEKEVILPLQKLSDDIKSHEAGTLMYLVHLPKFDFPTVPSGNKPIISNPMVRPGTLVFFEKYADWKAFEAHLYGKFFTDFVKENKDHFVLGHEGEPFVEVVFLEGVAGFPEKI